MDKKSKILIAILLVLTLASVGYTFYKIMIQRDYVISAQIDCDPYVEKCFIWECDPASTEEGEKCTGNPEEDIWYYKIAERNANRIPLCDPETDETCDPWTCEEGEKDCQQILCDEVTAEEQEASCNDPEEYTEENPIEEEAVECEEGDTECEAAQETVCEEGDKECLNAQSEEADGANAPEEDSAE
ncbi:MAG: hypothetical protein NT136_03685 [Candidatus Moranbacteria bacterium]|nr:hypothetical protein [Candidatus Moranbacteria bacterium]